MRIELTIKVTYLPTWGAYEGLRELIQNARDAEVEHNAPMSVAYQGGKVVITNEGSTLDKRDLLLGQTTKVGRADLIGKFGEGLKLGVLALVRAGHAVRIVTGGESWIPVIENSETFNEPVLVFKTRTLQNTYNRVSIEIDDISREDWKLMRKNFLFLEDEGTTVQTGNGTILINPENKGRVFVRGIFVQYMPDLAYGYNLNEADLDRDRRMVESWDLNYRIRAIWQEAVNRRPDLFENFTAMLEDSARDLSGIDEYAAGFMDRELRQQVTSAFISRHGQDAVPVSNLAESAEIGHLGKQGIVVNKPLGAILRSIMGTTDVIKEKLRNEATVIYGWHALSLDAQTHLKRAIALLEQAGEAIGLADIDVTDFRDPDIHGMCKDGRILLAKKALDTQKQALQVLIHELAHKTSGSGDGTKAHVSEIERLWSNVAEILLNAN